MQSVGQSHLPLQKESSSNTDAVTDGAREAAGNKSALVAIQIWITGLQRPSKTKPVQAQAELPSAEAVVLVLNEESQGNFNLRKVLHLNTLVPQPECHVFEAFGRAEQRDFIL